MYLVGKTYFVFSKYHGGREEDIETDRDRGDKEKEKSPA